MLNSCNWVHYCAAKVQPNYNCHNVYFIECLLICSLLATCKAYQVNPRLYLNSIIADMPYKTKASEDELLEMLPHKWKLRHPEAIIKKEEQ